MNFSIIHKSEMRNDSWDDDLFSLFVLSYVGKLWDIFWGFFGEKLQQDIKSSL